MPTVFPGALDALPRPTSTTLRDAPGFQLSAVIDSLADAIEAVEAKLGTGTGIQTAALASNAVTDVRIINGVSTQTTASASYADLLDLDTGPFTTAGGALLVVLASSHQHSVAGGIVELGFQLDAGAVVGAIAAQAPAAGQTFALATCHLFTGVASGSHRVKVKWLTSAATAYALSAYRRLIVMEVKR